MKMAVLLDYICSKPKIENPDGSYAATFVGGVPVAGPGTTSLGTFDRALDLGESAKAIVDITGLAPDTGKFCLRVVFKVPSSVTARQTLLESDLIPFTLFVDRGSNPTTYSLSGQVKPAGRTWAGPTTAFKREIQPGTWCVASLAFDTDTVALYVDDDLVSLYAFPAPSFGPASGKRFAIGCALDGKFHFNGCIAAVQWHAGIPEPLEPLLDERRSDPEWFVSHRYESLRLTRPLGEARTPLRFDPTIDAYVQYYENGLLMYHDGAGYAFEMHGLIAQAYRTLPTRSELGYLVSDERNTKRKGGRKNTFNKGGIYWSPQTGVMPVSGRIYLEYESIGESEAIGFPTRGRDELPGGYEQRFQQARIYHKGGQPKANVVQGAILDRFLAIGGTAKWGFPVTNELDVKKGNAVIGKFSDFEGCTIYWSGVTGAHEVHGDIRTKYRDELGGPAGQMGFPTSDEGAIPGVSGPGQYNTFQTGSLLWYGNYASMIVAQPFKVHVGRVDTKEEEGVGMGQNDLYFRIRLSENGKTLYSKDTGEYEERNVIDLNMNLPPTVTPNDPNKVLNLMVDVWESDDGAPFGGGDDHLGCWNKTLNMANAWGLRENEGILRSGAFGLVNCVTAAIQPQVDVGALTETQKFWGVQNAKTPLISYGQYAAAFRDVDSDPEEWDLTDWLEKAFYELVVDTLADGGNCFGMSLEAINARKGNSIYSLPIDRFKNWNNVANEFNIKHCHQVGASVVWWFLGEFVTGNTHDPVDVFRETQREAARGNNPVLCLSQNWDFSGAPHAVLPVGWDTSSKPWKLNLCDPNFPGSVRTLRVDPDNNTYIYEGSDTPNKKRYTGGEWSGGRLYYVPYDLVSTSPRTPIWDAILLLLAGTVVILGDDGQTAKITDTDGNDLDAFGTRAREKLQSGGRADGYFMSFKGAHDQTTTMTARPTMTRTATTPTKQPAYKIGAVVVPKAKGSVAGELLLRRGMAAREPNAPAPVGTAFAAHAPMEALLQDPRFRPLAQALAKYPQIVRSIANRNAYHVANDPRVTAVIDESARAALKVAAKATRTGDFIHQVTGRRDGEFRYALKQGLTQIELSGPLRRGEVVGVDARNQGTSKATIKVNVGGDKPIKVRIENRLGTGADRIRYELEPITVKAASPLEINAKPGLAGLEVVCAGQRLDVRLAVSAEIGGKKIRRTYDVPIVDGFRLSPAQILTIPDLNVAQIGRMFGSSTKRIPIRPRP
jgi:hypothetical protein